MDKWYILNKIQKLVPNKMNHRVILSELNCCIETFVDVIIQRSIDVKHRKYLAISKLIVKK